MNCRTLKTKGTEVCLFAPCDLVMHLLTLFSLVWIIGHVLSGWDGSDALPSTSNLCEYHPFTKLPFDALTLTFSFIVYQM
jgi:hypothetical protein